ncbi:hypothetical protein TIFTF001_045314 [Ficus carica]|uniref:Uncharacterized protein n=1 Tax=Ficus carica TaxID=3494 RepID=A0AA88CJT8_FICCA|nr:hypothetical protein TIFTF001_045314 [Ficus carica]
MSRFSLSRSRLSSLHGHDSRRRVVEVCFSSGSIERFRGGGSLGAGRREEFEERERDEREGWRE